MNDEKLIECVHQHLILYDLSDPKYMDLAAKNQIWEKIGGELNVDGSACKSRSCNIRDTYRKSLKRTATKSGQGAKNVKSYKYADQLSFLKRFLEERDTVSNICSTEECEDLNAENRSNVQIPPSPDSEDSLQEQSQQCTPQSRVLPARMKSAAAKFPAVGESASSKLMDNLIRKNDNQTTQQHPVNVFLNAMAPALKNLSAYDWHLAKSEIFNTVQKYELKSLLGQHNTASVYDNSVFSPSGASACSNATEYVHPNEIKPASGSTVEKNYLFLNL